MLISAVKAVSVGMRGKDYLPWGSFSRESREKNYRSIKEHSGDVG